MNRLGWTRPFLSEKSFPVHRVTPKKANREVGNFFSSDFHFLLTRMYWEYWEKNNTFFKNCEKKSPSRPFLAHSGGGQETTVYLRVASGIIWNYKDILSVQSGFGSRKRTSCIAKDTCHHLSYQHLDVLHSASGFNVKCAFLAMHKYYTVAATSFYTAKCHVMSILMLLILFTLEVRCSQHCSFTTPTEISWF